MSTCIVVHHLLVFYYVCPAETANLITKPETIPPEYAVVGECIKNNSPTSGDKPIISYTVDMGTWNIIIGCACDPGFQGVTEKGVVINCSECPAGTYSDSVSNSPCQSCPDNSEATQPGLSECPCVQNYYRAPDEGAEEACTRPPSAPLNVSVSSVTNTSAVLSWLPPEDDGGRDHSEIYYTATATGSDASVLVQITVNDTTTEVTSLTPFTDYTFSITSKNAVSSQATEASNRTSNISATTLQGVAGTVIDIEPTGSSRVSWSPPDPPNGEILYYNIRITHSESGELEQLIEVFSDTSIDVSDYVDSIGEFTVQVQAVTVVGHGNFSLPIALILEKNKESHNCIAIGVAVALTVVISFLSCVAGLLTPYIIMYVKRLRKKNISNDTHVYEIPDTKATPTQPLKIQHNAAYGNFSQQGIAISNTACDTYN